MMHKAWRSIGDVPYCFQGHPSNFKVTQDKKLPIFTRIECFRTVTQVWHQWLWNDAQSLMWYRRGAPLFSKVIHHISRSHRIKYRQFRPEMSVNFWTVSLSVCVFIDREIVRAITYHPFNLGSANLDQRCKTYWLKSLLFWLPIDLDIQGQI